MIITIDGPAGSGKSSVARSLADRLGYRFLDTGAMYRAVAFAAIEAGVFLESPERIADLCEKITIDLPNDNRVILNGEEVTKQIRTMAVTSAIHYVADNVHVRAHLVELQRKEAAESGNVVTEGRDQGTVVFPDAECKIFLTASPEVRARRRMADLAQRGEELTFEEVLEKQNERDRRDRARPIGRLVPADDATNVSTDDMNPEMVVDCLYEIVLSRQRS